MENEMRFYLKKIRQTIVSEENDYKPKNVLYTKFMK